MPLKKTGSVNTSGVPAVALPVGGLPTFGGPVTTPPAKPAVSAPGKATKPATATGQAAKPTPVSGSANPLPPVIGKGTSSSPLGAVVSTPVVVPTFGGSVTTRPAKPSASAPGKATKPATATGQAAKPAPVSGSATSLPPVVGKATASSPAGVVVKTPVAVSPLGVVPGGLSGITSAVTSSQTGSASASGVTAQTSLYRMQLKYGDIFVLEEGEYSGDDPCMQTFSGVVTIDGNPGGNPGASIRLVTNLDDGENGMQNNIDRPDDSGWVNLPQSSRSLYYNNLYAFNPLDFVTLNANKKLKLDVVIGGAILWEEDGGNSDLRKGNAKLVFDVVKAPLDAAAKELKAPFSVVKLVQDPKDFVKEWETAFANTIKKGLFETIQDRLFTDLVTGLSAAALTFSRSAGDLDDLIGIHLTLAVPLAAGVYKALLAYKDATNGLFKREFPAPGSLLTTKTIPSNKDGGASSLHVTYGFVSSDQRSGLGEDYPYQGGYGLVDDTGDSHWRFETPAITVTPM